MGKMNRIGYLIGRRMISVLPILQWLPGYRRNWLRTDCIAGITLAAYAIPVSLAYASLAGLPSQAGLYCYLFGGFVYALFGTSRQIAVGPTSAISILIGSGIGAMALGSAEYQLSLAMCTALLAGGIGIIAWMLQLGNFVSFVSETILSGFKIGAGLVIASTQVPKLLGMSSAGNEFFESIADLVRNFGDMNLPSLIVGVGSLILILLGERFLSGRPVALLVLILSVIAMVLFPLAALGVKSVGNIPPGFPHLGLPTVTLADANGMLGLALACFLLSYVESISGTRLDRDSIFDVQVKRLHEYKRQLLNLIHILHLYLRIKEEPHADILPRTFFFAAKSAAGYYMAKEIIRLANSISAMLEKDP
ncbi:MAG TPA: SulP family inorganic anion transporter, partial [Geobacteraceae bacterium]|nr:SulP family inorganic anion transporter [Geobacteraceae bacterium]